MNINNTTLNNQISIKIQPTKNKLLDITSFRNVVSIPQWLNMITNRPTKPVHIKVRVPPIRVPKIPAKKLI